MQETGRSAYQPTLPAKIASLRLVIAIEIPNFQANTPFYQGYGKNGGIIGRRSKKVRRVPEVIAGWVTKRLRGLSLQVT